MFWTLHTTWDSVVDFDGITSFITRNWEIQYLHAESIHTVLLQQDNKQHTEEVIVPPGGCFPMIVRSGFLQVGQ